MSDKQKLYEGYIVGSPTKHDWGLTSQEIDGINYLLSGGYRGSGFPKIYTSVSKVNPHKDQRVFKVGVYLEEVIPNEGSSI